MMSTELDTITVRPSSNITPVVSPRVRTVGNVNTKVKVTCGCGFLAWSLSEGESHLISTGHTLNFFGEIRNEL